MKKMGKGWLGEQKNHRKQYEELDKRYNVLDIYSSSSEI